MQPDSPIMSVQPLFFESQGNISIGRELLHRAVPAGTLPFQAFVNTKAALVNLGFVTRFSEQSKCASNRHQVEAFHSISSLE